MINKKKSDTPVFINIYLCAKVTCSFVFGKFDFHSMEPCEFFNFCN